MISDNKISHLRELHFEPLLIAGINRDLHSIYKLGERHDVGTGVEEFVTRDKTLSPLIERIHQIRDGLVRVALERKLAIAVPQCADLLAIIATKGEERRLSVPPCSELISPTHAALLV
jgi:hypothetical protein